MDTSANGQQFGDLGGKVWSYSEAKVVVLPLPYDSTTSYKTGSRSGPAAILEASQALEMFDEELGVSPLEVGLCTLAPVEPDARGPEHYVAAVEERARPIAGDGKFLLGLGGEHTVTLGLVRAYAAVAPVTVLQIDAHADLRDSYQRSPYSHACVMRRIREHSPIVQVGIRAFSAEEHAFMQAEGLRPFTMGRIRREPDWIDQVVAGLSERVYLTIDLDGLDPSICPGVGTPEPGGLGWYEVVDLIARVCRAREVVAADVVECLPLPGQHHTEFLSARLAYKILAHRFVHALRGRP